MEILANQVLRETYRPHTDLQHYTKRPMHEIRNHLIQARKFVLDPSMSAFLADLATIPMQSVAHERRPQVMDTMRHGARLPHPATWVEIDGHAFRDRMLNILDDPHDAYGNALAPTDEVPQTWGWLLEQHPKIDTAVRMMEFSSDNRVNELFAVPFQWCWQTVDQPLPWHADTNAGELAHGITGFRSPYMGVMYDGPIEPRFQQVVQHEPTGFSYTTHSLVAEMGGVLRYMMAFLCTLNDVPVISTEVVASRGFVARGRHRKFMDHTMLRLNVPQRKDTRKLAHRVFAAARKRAHTVRGHWREFRKAGDAPVCSTFLHVWHPPNEHGQEQCDLCGVWRTWIPQHQRGDATLGYVMHDYSVHHEGGDEPHN
jgi:hypothetical protein